MSYHGFKTQRTDDEYTPQWAGSALAQVTSCQPTDAYHYQTNADLLSIRPQEQMLEEF